MMLGYHPLATEPIGAGTTQVSYIINDPAELTYYFFEIVVTPDGTILIPGGVDYIFDNELVSLSLGGSSYQVFSDENTLDSSITVESIDNQSYNFEDTLLLSLNAVSVDSPILYKIELGLPLGMFSYDPIGGEQFVPLNEIDIAVTVLSANSVDNYAFTGVDLVELRTLIEDTVIRGYGYNNETLELEIEVKTSQRNYTFLASINIDDIGQLRWNVEPDSMYIANTKELTSPQIWIG